MGPKTLATTARYAQPAPAHKPQALGTLVRSGSVSALAGYKMAAGAKKPRGTQKPDKVQLIASK